jgi:hypothetical protein
MPAIHSHSWSATVGPPTVPWRCCASSHSAGGWSSRCAPAAHTRTWLDSWRRDARSRYLVFADSDMDFRRPGWLSGLVQRRRETGAALVALGVKPMTTGLREPVFGRLVRTMPAPTTWLFMIDAFQVADISESMAYRSVDTENVPEGCILYDTAASFLERVHDRGLRVATMPRRYQRRVKHYGSLTWMPPAGEAGRRARDNRAVVGRRLRWVRTLDAADGGFASMWASIALSPSLEEAVELVARARRKAAGTLRRRPRDPGARARWHE